jgi:hypothetical protein
MNSAWLTWSAAPCLVFLLFGCQRDNPAFDPDVGGADGGSEDNGEASTTQTSTTQTSAGDGDGDGDAGDGDGDAGDGDGDGDGDAGDGDGDGDPSMEGPVVKLDMPVGECLVDTHSGLVPRFGRPEQFEGGTCPAEIATYVRVGGVSGAHWLASKCPLGCGGFCDQQQHVIGAGGLPNGLAMLFPPVNFNPNTPWVGCYYVEAEALVSETDDACVYASLSAHTHDGPETPLLFNANRDSWGLTTSAALHYDDWAPEIVDGDMACPCDELEIDCCMGTTVKAKQFFLGDPVPPGEVGGILLNMFPYTFYAAQAQSGTTCDLDPETSWALWLEQ